MCTEVCAYVHEIERDGWIMPVENYTTAKPLVTARYLHGLLYPIWAAHSMAA